MINDQYVREYFCDFCRMRGHEEHYCRGRIMYKFYSKIQGVSNYDEICWKIIENFSIVEISFIYESVHYERNIPLEIPYNQKNLMDLISQIVSIVNEDPTRPETFTQDYPMHNNELANHTDAPRTPQYSPPHNNNNDEENNNPPPPLMDIDNISSPPPLMDMSGNLYYNENDILYANNLNGDIIYYDRTNDMYDEHAYSIIHDIQYTNEDPIESNKNPLQILMNDSINIFPDRTELLPLVGNDNSCPICFEKYTNNNIIKTNCDHCFCYTCVTKFTRYKKQCPLCRAYIYNLNVHVENISQSILT